MVRTSFPFDRRTNSGLPCTRMLGKENVSKSPVCWPWQAVLRYITVVVLSIIMVPASGGMPLAQKHETRHIIDQLEDDWREAILTSNIKVMDSLLAQDYMAITPSGAIQSRDEALQILSSGRIHFNSLNLTDRKVRFYSGTAVVTSLADVQATTPDGPITGKFRYTRIYIRNGQGKWKIVSFEANRVREPGPRRHPESH